jgi:hypothetical protein
MINKKAFADSLIEKIIWILFLLGGGFLIWRLASRVVS